MGVIRLSESDIRQMVVDAVRLLRESADEKKGIAMAGKEDVIREIVDCIRNWWEGDHEDCLVGKVPIQGPFDGMSYGYLFIIPKDLSRRLGIAENMEIQARVVNYVIEKGMDHVGDAEYSVNGRSDFSPQYMMYNRPTMTFEKGCIELDIPAINGRIKYEALSSTLYHELNHEKTNLQLARNGNEGSFVSHMSKRRNMVGVRNNVYSVLRPENPFIDMVQRVMYGSDLPLLRKMNHLIY